MAFLLQNILLNVSDFGICPAYLQDRLMTTFFVSLSKHLFPINTNLLVIKIGVNGFFIALIVGWVKKSAYAWESNHIQIILDFPPMAMSVFHIDCSHYFAKFYLKSCICIRLADLCNYVDFFYVFHNLNLSIRIWLFVTMNHVYEIKMYYYYYIALYYPWLKYMIDINWIDLIYETVI